MHVGLLYTRADEENKRDNSIDPHGALQMDLTVKAIEGALISNGHKVTRIGAGIDLLRDIKSIENLEVIFNACTGITNKIQQANVVGMLELTGLPFVGSSLSSHIFGLHKEVSKLMFLNSGIKTPNFQVFKSGDEPISQSLKYPLIIKPEHEGSSLGITDSSLVYNEKDLRDGIIKIFEVFNQKALVEEFIVGREFTIGLLGNNKPEVLPIQEIIFDTNDGMGFMTVDIKANDAVKVKCPADIDSNLENKIKDQASIAYRALGCRGYARIDVRVGRDGVPYFLEINTLPGMQPDYSDFPRVAIGGGYTYEELIQKLLDLSLSVS